MAFSLGLSSRHLRPMIGETISHYRVLRTIGGGGMGEVYEAEDLTLGRRVALKFLSNARPITSDALRRFEREARAASALNHPNICTIHEFGEHGGQRFIVMELLHGRTLRDRLKHHPCRLDECLPIAIEVADALDAAHRARIVHRDVTPTNIFITDEHHAKVVDFGLAKIELVPAAIAAEASTHPADPTLTSPGAVMGTIAYMSPEQIQGEDIDGRSDLFSFGCVLYEMATGARPFGGKTPALIFDAILHETPVPVTVRNPSVPLALQQVVDKALEKDRTLRYQSAAEMKRDLERVRRDASAPPPRRAAITRRRWWPVVASIVIVIAAGAAGTAVYFRGRTDRDAIPTGVARQITSMPGLETDPVISPDGSTIAFAAHEGDANDDIWMVDVHGGPPQRVTTNSANDRYPAWFPDGAALAFVSDRGGRASIWTAPRLDGDAATLLVAEADEPAISPDGEEIAFVRPRGGHKRVAIARVANPSDVRFITTDADGKWDHSRPAWSPDGQTICYDAWDGLWLVPAHGGKPRRLTTADAHNDAEPAWSTNGRYVYFTGLHGRQASLWRVSSDGGSVEQVTVGSSTERTPRLSRDGRLLAFSTALGTRDIVIRNLATGEETQFGSSREEAFPVFAPDGSKVYFLSDRWGSLDIWSQDLADGKPVGPAHRLAQMDGVESHITCSPDGRWIAYYRILGGRRDIFVIPSTGGSPTSITDDPAGSFDPAWSPDGSHLAFASERGGTRQIWTQPISAGHSAGPALRITSGPALHSVPAWSPDGIQIAYILSAEPGRADVAIVAADGKGESVALTSGANVGGLRWDLSSGALLAGATWAPPQFQIRVVAPVPPRGIAPVPLGTDSLSALFDISRDGRFVVFPRGVMEGDVWVLDARSAAAF